MANFRISERRRFFRKPIVVVERWEPGYPRAGFPGYWVSANIGDFINDPFAEQPGG